uniref:Uncharacterized protein n=1 Tax=Chromera velia CCMP2878 TaxID=1169474 RepID=A0A0G4HY03_9ALVE|eukprot:Cvel_9392.t1-p1 / transcript=Cvel_9392.t1 / gene=Cvel_9392 / organism=Chromera_velia_CCMP2878 / gene_product=hypothetical protein / transcript_product=hypothetical protein / location=Cvel_scaffold539:70271-71638(+) / protein_length=72 / sequence_SO=supercontig / SO=protein_coding / is_pseudo=false
MSESNPDLGPAIRVNDERKLQSYETLRMTHGVNSSYACVERIKELLLLSNLVSGSFRNLRLSDHDTSGLDAL